MTFDPIEKSAESGSPLELYTFQAGGTFNRFTSQTNQFIDGSETFEPLPISHTAFKLNEEKNGTEITVRMPASEFIPNLFVEVVPQNRVALTIERVHRTHGS